MTGDDITRHYGRGGASLQARLDAALGDDGADPAQPTLEALAPYDQFHGRGVEATEEIAALMQALPDEHWLDVGSGIGGPARYFAVRCGVRVTGIDLTPEFCEVARELTRRMRLQDRIGFDVGDALAMPYAAASFDGATSMNVTMNIADKPALYREIGRVLRPGARFVLSEIARGAGGPVDFPTPWAAGPAASFLATVDDTRQHLTAAGFDVVAVRSTLEAAKAYGAHSRAQVERGGKPPHRAVMLIHQETAPEAMANVARALNDGRIVPVEILARRRS
jgi:ubiquinone/menaquinone biosynthesis C-methylase UbiE